MEVTSRSALQKNSQRAARLRYRQRRHDLAVASDRLRTAATEALSFPVAPPMRIEIEQLLREIERFAAATGLKVEWPEPPPERKEVFRRVLGSFRRSPRNPRQ
jgi:hypothetical protein